MSVYLEPKELKDAYSESETWTEKWQLPFDEYERIAGNKLSKTLSKNMPRVNDGSLAASLLETPMQVLPALQVGKFTPVGRKDAWLGEIANIIWKTRILPNANTQATFFDKEQIALYRALKYGAQPRYNFFVSTEKYTGSDWSLPYVKNVKLEPGKYSVEDCDYVFLDVYYTKLQLKKIIDNIKSESKKSKEEGNKADTSWDVKSLEKLADMAMTDKEIKEQNINERDKQIKAAGIKTTICFNKGIGAPFYMFTKHLETDEMLRTWKNPDPTGSLPITMQYCYETLESPYGTGRVELAGPTQNVLDYMTQAHVLATQLGLQPPKKIMGSADTANLNSIVSAPDALWLLGQANVEVVQTVSQVYTQFPTNYGIYKAQLQNLQGRTDGSVSASSGNPEFSKTPAGIKMQEGRTNSQDNYLRNKSDSASAKMCEKMMNVHLAQMQGADILDIAEEDRERLEKAGYFDENPATKNTPSLNEIPVLYEDIRDTFKFEYDARPESDESEKSRWVEILDIVTSNPNVMPMLQADGYQLSIGEIIKNIISNSGTVGGDKVLIKLDPEKLDMDQPQIDPMTGLRVQEVPDGQYPETPQESAPEQVQMVMEQYGVDEVTAQKMILASNQGHSEADILAAIERNR